MENKQHCRVGKMRSKINPLIMDPECDGKICHPVPILGYPGEYCEKCNKSN